MPYDEEAAQRVRKKLSRRRGIEEKKMFGGIAFLLQGNICVGVWKEFLIARVGIDDYEAALRQPCIRPFDITGGAMRGWVMVEPEGFAGESELSRWVLQAVEFVKTLPAK